MSLIQHLGWPSFRTNQILRWLYQKRVRNIDEMTDLSLQDRHRLQSLGMIPASCRIDVRHGIDRTKKLLLELADGNRIESVIIPDGDRLTLCLSTQVGCSLDCGFCLTARMGLRRNLKAAEIIEQFFAAETHLHANEQLTSLVFMGMGEPLANLDHVSEAIARLTNRQWGIGFPARRITISTAGLASRLKDVASLGVNLAISLNATTNEQRTALMPKVNTLHPLPELLEACRAYPLAPGRRLTFEYVLLAGVNDTEQDASRLPKLLQGIRSKINLIPFNEFPGSPFHRPDDQRIARFQARLRSSGFDVFIRKSRGRDILGACGQLGDLPT